MVSQFYIKTVEIYSNRSHFVNVRPICAEEEGHWDDLMRAHHYLGLNGLIGERIKYVAVLDGKWVGILAWAASAYKCSGRDKWIGWSFRSTSNLKFIANNWRFLILPEVKIKNLASKILSLNLKRLSHDWEQKYEHPIFLVETFVDESKFNGACYKADNWIFVGKTAGFQKGHESYVYHGLKKLTFIKPLIKEARMKLKGNSTGSGAQLNIEEIPIFGPDGLLAFVKTIPDPRSKKGRRYRSDGFLVLCLFAILSGATGYVDIHRWMKNAPGWLIKELRIWRIPCVSQVRRILMRFDTDQLEKLITSWLLENVDLAGKQIAFDGKTVRGSKNGEKRAIQLVSATTTDQGIVVAQRRIPETTNEIPVTRQIMNDLPLGCSTTSADAAHSQISTVKLVDVKSEGGIFIFKDNQKKVKTEIQQALKDRAFSP